MAGAPDVFAFVQTELDGPFANAVTQQTNSGLSFIAANFLHSAAAIVILTILVLAVLGKIEWQDMVKRCVALIAVVAIIGHAALYNQFVTQPILKTVPNLIAMTFSHGGAGTTAQQFSSVSDNIERVGDQLRAQATPAPLYIPERLEIWLAGQISDVVLIVTYAVNVFIQLYGGILCIAGGILLVFYVFQRTRHISEAWANMVFGQILATILISATIQFDLIMFTGYMQQAGDLPLGGGGLNISEGIRTLVRINSVLLLGLFMAVASVLLAFSATRSGGVLDPASIRRSAITTITAGRI